jgi:hypothetical protein
VDLFDEILMEDAKKLRQKALAASTLRVENPSSASDVPACVKAAVLNFSDKTGVVVPAVRAAGGCEDGNSTLAESQFSQIPDSQALAIDEGSQPLVDNVVSRSL